MRSFRDSDRKQLLIARESFSKIAESYRSLRTNIGMCSLDTPPKTLMITSAVPMEGKTTTIINMGISFSQIGLKVLIVDTDMRNPKVHTFFDIDKNIGLTNALASIYGASLKSGKIQNRRDFVRGGYLSLADIFYIIRVQKKTGALTIKTDESVFLMNFQDGFLINADVYGEKEEIFLLQIIKDSKRLSADKVEEVKQRGKETGKCVEYVVLNLGLVEKKELEGFVRLKVSKIIKDIFSLSKASFAFEKNDKDALDQITLPQIQDEEFKTEFALSETPYVNHIIEEYVTPIPLENLYILACGPLPQNPSEILSSQSFRHFIKKLSEIFDLVIFDSPPVTAVTDPSLIAPLVDGVILVVRSRMAHRNVIRSAKDQLDKTKAHILGVVLNDMDISSNRHYYYSKYGYNSYGKYYNNYDKYYGSGARSRKREKIKVG